MQQLWTAAAIFVISLALWRPFPASRKRFRNAVAFLLLWAVAEALSVHGARETATALLELAGLQAAAGVIFAFAVRRVNLPRFKVEMIVVAGYAVILFQLFYALGVNVTGIFATSAVATAVVGLALQDMLSNIAGGLALELEREVRVGDYIRCGESAGWVKHVRLRHTAIETPDGERVILPNSYLVRTSVTIVPKGTRRFVPFSLPYERDPQDVADAVASGLAASPIQGVATEPAPSCIVKELAAGHVQYAAVVWVTEPGRESNVLSVVQTRLWFILRRAGIPPGEISTLVDLRRMDPPPAAEADDSGALDVLRTTPIFRLLDEESLVELSAQLRRLSFARGELILRQGAQGDSMYFVTSGDAAITYRGADGVERQVAVVSRGDFLGEATLLTGEARTANAVALSRVDCFRLDKAGLHRFMKERPELAEDMSVVVAHRQMELDGVRQQLDRETAQRRQTENQVQLLERIRQFFELDSGD